MDQHQQKNDVLLTVRYPQQLIDRLDEHRRAAPGKIPTRQQVLREIADAHLKPKQGRA